MNFVECSYPFLNNHKYGPRENNPVNLDNVIRFIKYQEKYYPDNEGLPAIKFYTVNGEYSWFYCPQYTKSDDSGKKLRDKDYQILLKKTKEKK